MNEPTLAAAVVYYGAPPTEAEDIAKIKAPVLGNYGADDQGPAPDQVKAFEAAMKKAGKSVDVKIYEGAGHAFANVNNPWGGYREEAAKDAWARTTAFLAKYLKKSSPPRALRGHSRSASPPARRAGSTAGGSCSVGSAAVGRSSRSPRGARGSGRDRAAAPSCARRSSR